MRSEGQGAGHYQARRSGRVVWALGEAARRTAIYVAAEPEPIRRSPTVRDPVTFALTRHVHKSWARLRGPRGYAVREVTLTYEPSPAASSSQEVDILATGRTA
jgi:hypothetical protein